MVLHGLLANVTRYSLCHLPTSCVFFANKDKDKNKNKDKDENEKSYIGIFVEKECGYLSKNIMPFGAGMKVVWPDNVKNEVVNRLKGMLSLYE